VKTLFDGPVNIHYSQFYISLHADDVDDDFDLDSYFIDQENGLVGAAQENYFFITAPSEVSVIKMTVRLLESPPEISEEYDEIVEVSSRKGAESWYLSEWAWERTHELPLPTADYRMRLSIAGFDLEYSEELQEADDEYWENPVEGQHFVIEFWPEKLKSDEIIKQTSVHAKHLHDTQPITKMLYEKKREEVNAMLEDDRPWWKFW